EVAPAFGIGDGGSQGRRDAIDNAPRRPPGLGEQLASGLAERADRLTLGGSRGTKFLPVSTRQDLGLRLAEPRTCLEKCVDVRAVPPRELVHHPRDESRLPQALDLIGCVSFPFLPQLRGKLVPPGCELVQRGSVETIQLALEVGHCDSDELTTLVVHAVSGSP